MLRTLLGRFLYTSGRLPEEFWKVSWSILRGSWKTSGKIFEDFSKVPSRLLRSFKGFWEASYPFLGMPQYGGSALYFVKCMCSVTVRYFWKTSGKFPEKFCKVPWRFIRNSQVEGFLNISGRVLYHFREGPWSLLQTSLHTSGNLSAYFWKSFWTFLGSSLKTSKKFPEDFKATPSKFLERSLETGELCVERLHNQPIMRTTMLELDLR